MTRRLALVALWIAATTVAVLLATFAVRLAGDKVVAQGPATVTRDEVEAGLPAGAGTVVPEGSTAPAPAPPGDPAAPGPAAPSSPTTAGATTTVAPGAAPTPTSVASVPAGGSDGGRSGGSGNDDPVAPATTAVPVTSPPAAVEQSFPLVGGSVRMRCVGDTASLVASSPNPGYAMEVRSTGPREVEVRFTGPDRTSELEGTCVGGQVVAEPKESGGGGDDGYDGRDG